MNKLLNKLLIGAVLAVLPFFAIAAEYDLTNDVFDAAEQEKSPIAQYTLGLMYLNGQGVTQDKKSGLSWLEKSSKQGYSLAMHRLGTIYLSDEVTTADPTLAVKHIAKAAQKGYSPSQYLLGTLYQKGEQGIDKDTETAKKWFSLAAGQGYNKAKLVLAKLDSENASGDAQTAFDKGFTYLKGRGVDRDYKQAAKWFSIAAEQGNADAQYNLGELYNKGRGVKKNKKTALKWYKTASAQGHVKAKYRTKGCAFC